jgi:hypothetical protein
MKIYGQKVSAHPPSKSNNRKKGKFREGYMKLKRRDKRRARQEGKAFILEKLGE